jgi:glycosyltransferase involved in cell wall biosynthesis
MHSIKYVLVTAARNEGKFIEGTIKSVVSQALLPQKWVIVSDGSTDNTDEIIQRYADEYDFIEYMRLEPMSSRNFESKVHAIRTGDKMLKNIDYDYWGNLDADIILDENYYQQVTEKFKENPKLGIAGGIIFDRIGEKKFIKNIASADSVGCAIQLFRRNCYEQIGGYVPLKVGGEDAVAEAMARMKGWEVRSFPELKVWHLRRTGSGKWNTLKARFYRGIENCLLGYHPIYLILKSIYRLRERPYILGSMLMLAGYYWASFFLKGKGQLDPEVTDYIRNEQIHKMNLPFLTIRKMVLNSIKKKPHEDRSTR